MPIRVHFHIVNNDYESCSKRRRLVLDLTYSYSTHALVIAAVVLKKQDAVEEAHTGNSQPLIGLESSSELRDPSRGFSTLFSRVE